jgi:hypothetical protein
LVFCEHCGDLQHRQRDECDGGGRRQSINLGIDHSRSQERRKVSWSTNLEEHEVRDMHKAFQQEFPLIKINYKRVMGGEQRQRVLSEMQAGLSLTI